MQPEMIPGAPSSNSGTTLQEPEIVLIAGLPQHGKTTTASLMSKLLNTPAANTSDLIYEALAQIKKTTIPALRAMDKASIRKDLIKTGDNLCRDDPAAIISTLVHERGFTIIAGVRKKAEVEAFRAAGNKCVLLWVARPDVSWIIPDNTDLKAEDADYTIVNQGGIQGIAAQLRSIFRPQ